MTTVRPAQNIQNIPKIKDTSKVLEELLENVFARGYTKLNQSLKNELESTSKNICEYYLKKIEGEKFDLDEQEKKFPGHFFNSIPYNLNIISFSNEKLKDSQGAFLLDVRKLNKEPFSEHEKVILDNFPIQLSIISREGKVVSKTVPVTFEVYKEDKSIAQISFVFDVQSGEVNVVEGIETFDDYTRIIDLPVRTPLIPRTNNREPHI